MFTSPKGTKDWFGIDKNKLDYIFKVLKHAAKSYNYKQIITPVFESLDLFSRTSGEDSEIVSKQMYVFNDKSNRKMALRPEGTASTLRAAIENKLLDQGRKQKLYYIEKMYRYEQPQKGRMREFFQFGVENIGSTSIEVDAEVILFASKILRDLKIDKYKLEINYIGSKKTRENYIAILRDFFKAHQKDLTKESIERLKTNPLRILDTKDSNEKALLKKLPSIMGFLTAEELESFGKFEDLLKKLNISYEVNPFLVRGLDYYNGLVFEFISTDEQNLGAQSTLIGGGRYDYLVEQLSNGKLNSPAIGFALGIERIILAANNLLNLIKEPKIDYYVIPTSNDLLTKTLALKLRNILKINLELDLSDSNLNKKIERALKTANKILFIGPRSEKFESSLVLEDIARKEKYNFNSINELNTFIKGKN